MEMKIKSTSGTPLERKHATKVLPILANHHFLLVTLLLWNASATEALPIFLNHLVSPFASVLISVTLILLFGEILPSSILMGPNQLEFAALLTPLVYFICFIFFPVAYPLSAVLDCLIGSESNEVTLYDRQELSTMIHLQEEGIGKKELNRKYIRKEEVQIIEGALKFRDVKAVDAMTEIARVFTVPLSMKLTLEVS
jgi:metal transporter CNNM